MSEDNTQQFYRTDDPAGGALPPTKSGGSKIFNTSVRGWIALIMAIGLIAAVLIIVVGSGFQLAIPSNVESQILAVFNTVAGFILKDYFTLRSREGQSQQPQPTTPTPITK